MNYPKYEWDAENRIEYFAKKVKEFREARAARGEAGTASDKQDTEHAGEDEREGKG